MSNIKANTQQKLSVAGKWCSRTNHAQSFLDQLYHMIHIQGVPQIRRREFFYVQLKQLCLRQYLLIALYNNALSSAHLMNHMFNKGGENNTAVLLSNYKTIQITNSPVIEIKIVRTLFLFRFRFITALWFVPENFLSNNN